MSTEAVEAWLRGEWTPQQRLAITVTESLHRHIKVRWWRRKPSRIDLLPLGALVAADIIADGPTKDGER